MTELERAMAAMEAAMEKHDYHHADDIALRIAKLKKEQTMKVEDISPASQTLCAVVSLRQLQAACIAITDLDPGLIDQVAISGERGPVDPLTFLSKLGRDVFCAVDRLERYRAEQQRQMECRGTVEVKPSLSDAQAWPDPAVWPEPAA
ncbi:hypothetical protein [Tautonia plasticadhaerens]|uniref:Uncharacterized protein n=1 Tax=Tautonia plasticadhaerens TaxID=2527974 RepID=A0A518H2A7_9BACT|nr:hypothetical protein [Tautonia plasticadhaerens]QDV34947.1 hypothetical protein ElP_28440 [Tautonia plasticadhaerens]